MISLRDVVTGFGNRDPLAEVWRRSLRGGAAVITGVPPLRYIGDGRPLTDYLISGNTVQDGTPSPEDPVDVVGCGVRTGNLFDYLTMGDGVSGCYLDDNGVVRVYSQCAITAYIPCEGNEFTVGKVSGNAPSICLYDKDKNFIAGKAYSTGGANTLTFITIKSSATAFYIRFSYFIDKKPQDIMLNLGSEALPYEPYGYKNPLTVNGTEYPIYLGQVETTRRIRQRVLTGKENFVNQFGTHLFTWSNFGRIVMDNSSLICSSAVFNPVQSGLNAALKNGEFAFQYVYGSIAFKDERFSTPADFKSYLAAQYAAGTPVTVWYVLAEPETAIVNEPLMKIGDYADTISFAQSGVTIPTVNGENVLDVPTTVPPSEITIKGGISSV